MPRARKQVAAHRRHQKIRRQAKGYWGARHRWIRPAKETTIRALAYAYRDRRQRKRDFRQLWIARINAAARSHGLTYSRFTEGLRKAGVAVDRKMLADLAVKDDAGFAELAKLAHAHATVPAS
jgi:large subunit ribosomal protein L20